MASEAREGCRAGAQGEGGPTFVKLPDDDAPLPANASKNSTPDKEFFDD